MRIFSFGAGHQSSAALVLQAQGAIEYEAYVFSNVGEDSENPDTLRYYEEYLVPFARGHGIRLIEARHQGKQKTVLERIERTKASVPIPMYWASGIPAFSRACTMDYKIRVINKWLVECGHGMEKHAQVGIGFSTDEIHRINTSKIKGDVPWKEKEYPLVDLRLNRSNCCQIVREAGLPDPPKSSCWFCPYHSLDTWKMMKSQNRQLFDKAVDLERWINERQERLGKDKVFLSRYGKPLDIVVGDQIPMFGDDLEICESGYCMT